MVETATGDPRYKIGDVCRIADVQPYVLRYWESEFPVLAPDKSVPGPRTYSGRELKLIEQIKRLLYDEGYTIAGAKKRLEAEGGGKTEAKGSPADTRPAVVPVAKAEKSEKAERSEKPEKAGPAEKADKADRAEKPVRAPRPTRPVSKAMDAIEFELPAPEVTIPVAAKVAAGEAEAAPPKDERIESAVAELKEILAVLSRPAP